MIADIIRQRDAQGVKGTVVGRQRESGESECRNEESATLIDHGPFGGQTPTGSGSGGPVWPASVRHSKTSWLFGENLNVIRPSRSTRSSSTGNDDALHLAHRA